jgi:DNA replicative helicase MCM subunit Mcm2 (Cdc46/Mcm family)
VPNTLAPTGGTSAAVARRTPPWSLFCAPARSKDEIQAFEQFAKLDGIHDELFARIAPNIYGSPDIKRAIACLLFGGARKVGVEGRDTRPHN